jgi:hypothetical protein
VNLKLLLSGFFMRKGWWTKVLQLIFMDHSRDSDTDEDQVWAQAEANITRHNMTPEQATEEAAKRIKQLFEQNQK